MKVVKFLGIVLAALFVICVVGGLILPDHWKVEASIVVNATPERVHQEIATPRNFVKHAEKSAKSQGYTGSFEYDFGSVESGKGAWWISKTDDSRVQIWITESDAATGIEYEGAIEKDEVNDHGSITYKAVEGGTLVTWTDKGELGIPVAGPWFGMALSSQLEKAFQGILLEVKTTCEKPE